MRIRYNTRSLLVFVFLVVLFTAWYGDCIYQRRIEITSLNDLQRVTQSNCVIANGREEFQYRRDNCHYNGIVICVANTSPKLFRRLELDIFKSVTAVDICNEMNDRHLEILPRFRHLKTAIFEYSFLLEHEQPTSHETSFLKKIDQFQISNPSVEVAKHYHGLDERSH